MKSAFKKDQALLEEIQEAIDRRLRRLWWLGQSGFLLAQQGRAILFDPYLSDSLTRKYAGTDKPHVRITERVIDPAQLGTIGVIDVITSSHNHTDHLDAETLTPILDANPNAKLVCAAANRDFVIERLGAAVADRLLPIDAGHGIEWSQVRLRGIPAAHNEVERDGSGRCKYLGFVAQWHGLTVYHSGDTLDHAGLRPALAPFTIDLAFLPINGNLPERRVAGNLSGPEAARLAHAVAARIVIPCHFDLFEFNTAPPSGFIAECQRLGQAFHLLANGESLVF